MMLTWWQRLDRQNRRWLFLNAIVVTAAINFVVSFALGWLNALGLKHVAVWSVPLAERTSIFTDAIGTFFFLPLTTCLLCTLAIRVEQRTRRLPSIVSPSPRLATRLPTHPLRRGLALGAVTLMVLSPIAALILGVARVGDMSPLGFQIYAALLGVGLGLVVTPVVALLAMADTPSETVTPVGHPS